MKLIIHTDGGSRGNPGKAAIGFVVENDAGIVLEKCGKYIGVETNNVAEYRAVIAAWDWVIENETNSSGLADISFVLDSELVVRQLQGKYKVKDQTLRGLWAIVLERQKQFLQSLPKVLIRYQHVLRSQNTGADRLVNEALDALGN